MERGTRYVPPLLVASYALWCLCYGVDARWHPSWDAGIYLLTARSLAAGQGYAYLGEPFFLRPPGFSYLLSWMVPPQGNFDFYELNFAMMAVAMTTLAVIYSVMRRLHGPWRAAGLTLALGTSGLFVSQFNLVMSELPFLLLTFAAIALLLPGREDERSPLWRDVAGAAAIAAALYVRTAGVVLLPGLLTQRRLLGAVQILLVLVALSPWARFAAKAADDAPKPTTQLLNFTYTTPMLHADSRDPTSPYLTPRRFVGRSLRNAASFAGDVGRTLGLGTGWGAWAASLVVGLGFVAAARRRWSLLEWFALSYTGLIVLYAYDDSRLVLPLVIFFYGYFMVAVDRVAAWCAERSHNPHVRPVLWGTVIALLVSSNLTALATNLRSTPSADTFPMRPAVAWIRDNTPRDATLLTDLAPELSVLTTRRAYSYLYLGDAPLPATDYVVLHGPAPDFEPEVRQRSVTAMRLPGGDGSEDLRIYRMR